MDKLERNIETMRELLIQRGHNGVFASRNPISYWETEVVLEKFEELYPQEAREMAE